jgi:hypothetical protein
MVKLGAAEALVLRPGKDAPAIWCDVAIKSAPFH